MNLLLLDNFDSFTYMLKDYLEQLGVQCHVLRNDVSLATIQEVSFDALILSPGPGSPSESGITMECIHRYHAVKPILGVCLGHQAIGEYFGAQLQVSEMPVHGKTSEIYHNGAVLFNGIPSPFRATRYHSLVLNHMPNVLETLAQTGDGTVMALRHRQFPCYGVQFHPESCLTQYGMQLLQNFLETVIHPNVAIFDS